MSIKCAILTLKPVERKRRRADYRDIDPQDLTEDGVPHKDYSSPCIELHPFGGGISAEDY